jgi:probable rRNA maturation factor
MHDKCTIEEILQQTKGELSMSDEIEIAIKEEFRELVDEDKVRDIVQRVLKLETAPSPCEVSIVITDSETIHNLNRDYRGIDQPTDVLSFCLANEKGEESFPFILPPDDTTHLGEVIISYPQATEQAAAQGHLIDKELTLLLIHGILHLLGYSHEQPDDEIEMQTREKHLLQQFEVQSTE